MKTTVTAIAALSLLICRANAGEFESCAAPVRTIKASIAEPGRVAQVRVVRGAEVEKGDILVKLDSQVLEASRKAASAKATANASLQSLRVEAKLRNDRLAKLRQLEQTGAGTPEEVIRAEADAEVARLEVERALEQLRLLQLQVEEIDARLEQFLVRSPIEGVVIDVLCDEGEYIAAHQPQVATIVELDQLRATFYLPTDLALAMEVDAQLPIQFPETGQLATGVVEHVGAVTQADSGLARVDVLIDNADRLLRSGVPVILTLDLAAVK